MGKAWNSGVKKPAHEKQIIFKRWNREASNMEYYTMDDTRQVFVARANAEHEVASGAARYIEVKS